MSFTEDLFQSTFDLLETPPDVISGYNITDDDSLALPSMLPSLMTSDMLPPAESVNVLDMINQDMMLEDNLPSTDSSASTEMAYMSQYAEPSVAPFTSAGDVFLPPLPMTTTPNTFVKPLATFVKHTPPTSTRVATSTMKPSQRPASRSAHPALDPDSFLTGPVFVDQSQLLTGTTRTHSKHRSTSAKSSTKNSSSRCQGLQMVVKTPSRSARQGARTPAVRSLGRSILINSPSKSAFAATTRASAVRATTVTHTVTRTANMITDSTVAFATETVSYTAASVGHTIGQHATLARSSSFKTATVTSFTTSRTRPPTTPMVSGTYSTVVRSDTLTTSTLTSYTVSKPRTPASITAPMQTSYNIPACKMYSTPIISRVPATPGATAAATISRPIATSRPSVTPRTTSRLSTTSRPSSRHSTTSTVSERACEQFAILPTQTAYTIPADGAARTSPTTAAEVASRARARHVLPLMGASTSSSTGKSPAIGPDHGAYALTNVNPRSTSSASARDLTQSKISLPPGPKLYATTKMHAAKGSRSRHVAVTTDSQTFAISDGKGSFTTLTISSDFANASCGSLLVAQTKSSNASGVTSHTSSIASDSAVRPRSQQLLIPIANSQMNTSTSLGYLVTPPIGSDIITTRSASAAASTQSASTTASPMGTHTITTISSEALNRIRNRLLIPVAHNVPNTAAGSSSASASSISADSNRSRGPVTIFANQLISGASSRDASNTQSSVTSTVAASNTSHAFSVAPTQGTFLITSMGSSTSSVGSAATTRSSRTVVIPFPTSAGPVALTSTTVAVTTSRTFVVTTSGTECTSAVSTADAQSMLRNRLIVQSTTTESSKATPITAYAISRSRASQSLYAITAGSTAFTSSTKCADAATRNPATMTLITFATTTTVSPTTSSSHSLVAPSTTHSESTSTDVCTTATPTLANTGNRYVIKLATTPCVLTTSNVSSVTTAVTTPITTAALSPPEHLFLEPGSVSRLRTFPGPRTYSIAQRSAAGNPVPRMPVRNANPHAQKRSYASPAPLQIFADVVCPPTTTQSQSNTATQGQPRPTFTLSHSPGNSTLVVPQYKNTVFKNLSTIAHPSPERHSARFLTPRSSSERFVLNRSVAFVTSRRPLIATTSVQGTPTTARPMRFTYADMRSPPGRGTPTAAASESVPQPTDTDSNDELNSENKQQ